MKFISTCNHLPESYHLHVGGFPNWFQIRLYNSYPYIIFTRDDQR